MELKSKTVGISHLTLFAGKLKVVPTPYPSSAECAEAERDPMPSLL